MCTAVKAPASAVAAASVAVAVKKEEFIRDRVCRIKRTIGAAI